MRGNYRKLRKRLIAIKKGGQRPTVVLVAMVRALQDNVIQNLARKEQDELALLIRTVMIDSFGESIVPTLVDEATTLVNGGESQ